MMKLILFISIGFCSIFSFSQNLEFSDKTLSLGDIQEGSVKSFSFEYRNVSQDTLTVLDVLPSCGCTSVDFSTKKITPQERGELLFSYDASGKEGLERKTITVIVEGYKLIVLVFEVNVLTSKKK